MAKSGFRLNPELQKKWAAAMNDLRSISKKDDPASIQKLALQSGKRFIKNVASVTPPATGELSADAKKRGEEAILADLLKIALPVTAVGTSKAVKAALATADDLAAAHDRARANAAGRVNPRGRKEKIVVSMTTFNQVLRTLQSRVGWLAAGLNAAAERLGFSLPAWIKRHGQKFGRIMVRITNVGIFIRVTQNVPFADDVAGYPRRWNFALEKEITALQKQVKVIFDKKAAKAKEKLR